MSVSRKAPTPKQSPRSARGGANASIPKMRSACGQHASTPEASGNSRRMSSPKVLPPVVTSQDVLPAVHAVMRLAVHHRRAGCVSKADLQGLLAGSQHEDFLRWILERKRWFSSAGAIELNDLQLALEHFYGHGASAPVSQTSRCDTDTRSALGSSSGQPWTPLVGAAPEIVSTPQHTEDALSLPEATQVDPLMRLVYEHPNGQITKEAVQACLQGTIYRDFMEWIIERRRWTDETGLMDLSELQTRLQQFYACGLDTDIDAPSSAVELSPPDTEQAKWPKAPAAQGASATCSESVGSADCNSWRGSGVVEVEALCSENDALWAENELLKQQVERQAMQIKALQLGALEEAPAPNSNADVVLGDDDCASCGEQVGKCDWETEHSTADTSSVPIPSRLRSAPAQSGDLLNSPVSSLATAQDHWSSAGASRIIQAPVPQSSVQSPRPTPRQVRPLSPTLMTRSLVVGGDASTLRAPAAGTWGRFPKISTQSLPNSPTLPSQALPGVVRSAQASPALANAVPTEMFIMHDVGSEGPLIRGELKRSIAGSQLSRGYHMKARSPEKFTDVSDEKVADEGGSLSH